MIGATVKEFQYQLQISQILNRINSSDTLLPIKQSILLLIPLIQLPLAIIILSYRTFASNLNTIILQSTSCFIVQLIVRNQRNRSREILVVGPSE